MEILSIVVACMSVFLVGFLLGRHCRRNNQDNTPSGPRTEEEATDFLIARTRCSSALSLEKQKMYIEAMLKLNQEIKELRKKYQ